MARTRTVTDEAVEAAKVCGRCKESKPESEFRERGPVRESYCGSCEKQYKLDHKAQTIAEPGRHRQWQDTINACQDKNQKETRAKATEHYGAWTETDDTFLRENWNMPRKALALHLGRTYASIATRKLKLKKLSERRQAGRG